LELTPDAEKLDLEAAALMTGDQMVQSAAEIVVFHTAAN
jgi:hypothetical protein